MMHAHVTEMCTDNQKANLWVYDLDPAEMDYPEPDEFKRQALWVEMSWYVTVEITRAPGGVLLKGDRWNMPTTQIIKWCEDDDCELSTQQR